MENLKVEIGKRIDYIRIQNEMSKDKLAELLGISAQHLGKVISGESGLSVEKIVELSEKTGYPTDYILLGKEISFNRNIHVLLEKLKQNTKENYRRLEVLDFIIKN